MLRTRNLAEALWEASNCIITPHISGIGVASVGGVFQVLEMSLEKMEKGEMLITAVDREKGY
jgi:phosphoglycerate dehydrogenase-like enzyme